MQLNSIIKQWGLFWLVVVLGLIGATAPIQAQNDTAIWSQPQNVSQTGSITTPQLIYTTNNEVYVVWKDLLTGIYYRHGQINGDQITWSSKQLINGPFEDTQPLVAIDAQNRFHAIWTDTADRTLQYTQAPLDENRTLGSWSSPTTIADQVLNRTLYIDSNSTLHLAYIQIVGDDNVDAAVIYQRSDDAGANWSPAQTLYQSPYLREPLANDDLIIQTVATDANNTVIVAWDNQSTDQALFNRSTDRGQSWGSATVFDRHEPGDRLEATSPSQIRMAVIADQIHLAWQAGHQNERCGFYHKWSADRGATWTENKVIQELEVCSDNTHLHVDPAANLLLVTSSPNQTTLISWRGEQWSADQIQLQASRFVNNETNRLIIWDCHQLAITDNSQLLMLGCDNGNSQDVWMTTRSLADIDSWFNTTSVWTVPDILQTSPENVSNPLIISDATGRGHIFWQNQGSNRVQYSQWANNRWSRPTTLAFSNQNNPITIDVTTTINGKLFAVWRHDQTNELWFSQTDADRAHIAAEWTAPARIFTPNVPITGPHIHYNARSNTIYVTYAIPFNEGRGAYTITSNDNGVNWSPPTQIFDAAAAGWPLVGPPELWTTPTGSAHLLLTNPIPNSNTNQQRPYYMRANSIASPWEPAAAVGDTAVFWQQLKSFANGTIMHIWQESENQYRVGYRLSDTNGADWGSINYIPSLTNLTTPATLAQDRSGQLHLIYLLNGRLNHENWNGTNWVELSPLPLTQIPLETVHTVAMSGQSELSLLMIGADNRANTQLVGIVRQLPDLPNDSVAVPIPTPIIPPGLPTPTIAPTPTPEPTPITFPRTNDSNNNMFADNTTILVVATILSSLIVFSVSIYAIRRKRK